MENQNPNFNEANQYQQEYQYNQNQEQPRALPTEIRRKYPINVQDKKSEWLALEKHKQDVNEELRKNEQEIKTIRTKEIQTELDRKIVQKLEEKQDELKIKHVEALEMQVQRESYFQQQEKGKQDKKLLQSHIYDVYAQQKRDQLEKEQQQKNQKLTWEQRLLEYNRERLESEAMRQRAHKDYLTQERQNDLQRANVKQKIIQDDQYQNKRDYQELCKINAERELTKEENYKNFYKLAADNQNALHRMHYDQVLKPLQNREQELNGIINKNVDAYQKQRAQDELNRLLTRKQQLEQIRDGNLGQIGNHQYQKEAKQVEKQEKVKERLEDLNSYNQFLDFKKKEKADQQIKYKEFLDQQAREKQDIVQNDQRMTRAEKGFNKLDLQAYKGVDAGQYSMLPGWSPQIGQLPPKQNRERMQELVMQKARNLPSHLDAPINDPKIRPLANEINKGQNWQQSYEKIAEKDMAQFSMPNLRNQFQKVGEPIDKYNASNVIQKAYQTGYTTQPMPSSIFGYGHNPITNPMPFNIQNPYIAKEFTRAQSKNTQQNNIFQNAGGYISKQ